MDWNLFATVFAFNNLIFQTLQSESYKYWVVDFFKWWNFVAKEWFFSLNKILYMCVFVCVYTYCFKVCFIIRYNIIKLFSYDKRDALLAFFYSVAIFILLYPHRNQGLKIIWGLTTQICNNFPSPTHVLFSFLFVHISNYNFISTPHFLLSMSYRN